MIWERKKRGFISSLSAWDSDWRVCLKILPSRKNKIYLWKMATKVGMYSAIHESVALAKWLLEFLGFSLEFLGIKVWIFTVNSDWAFLGIPNHNNSGSKNLEIPRNSQKFQVYSHSEHQWLSLKSCKFKKFLGISRNV